MQVSLTTIFDVIVTLKLTKSVLETYIPRNTLDGQDSLESDTYKKVCSLLEEFGREQS